MLLRLFLSLSVVLTSGLAHASLQWSGVYRFEGLLLDKPGLDSDSKKKEYAVHHLVLKPKITVADGFEINARFDTFNGATDQMVHPTNQIGSDWGGSKNNNDRYYTSSAGNSGAEIIEVTQAYLTYAHNFGALVVGRAPLDFGLGMTYDAGNDLFDHWYDTRDLLGFKIHFGNIYIFPMYGKIREGSISNSDFEAEELMFQTEYQNEDRGVSLGFFYSEKKADNGQHDFPTTIHHNSVAPPAYTRAGDLKVRTMNFFYKKEQERLNYGFEFSYLSGDTGLVANGGSVDLQAFGVAAEVDYAMPHKSLDLGLKFGYASGDDKETEDKVEGYIFNRNYDVGMLLMNHPLGRTDLLGVQTFLQSKYDYTAAGTNAQRIADYDVEAISNVMYFAPSLTYHFSDTWSLGSTLVTAWLVEDPSTTLLDIDKSLGYELDLSVNFTPNDRVKLILEGAALLPGSAFEQSEAGVVDSKFTYGLMGKAAVSF